MTPAHLVGPQVLDDAGEGDVSALDDGDVADRVAEGGHRVPRQVLNCGADGGRGR